MRTLFRPGPLLTQEPWWAWRNVRGRGWRGALSICLLALALAANTLLFAVADSAVFHRVPYADADRLVEIQRKNERTGRPGSSFMSAALLDEWRRQTDLFSGVHGFLSKNLFLTGSGEPEIVATADITVGLPELLGARPRWGRSFIDGDDRQTEPQPVLIAEALARERFGDPAVAVGQKLETTGESLVVVGVMPADFRFPEGAHRIWRALDPRGPLSRGFGGVSSIARLAPGVPFALVGQVMQQRSQAIAAAAGAGAPYAAQPGQLRAVQVGPEARRLFLLLLGAALCLLLIACANVASLELAAAVLRARTYAVQMAIGASRSSLARVALMEGLLLLTAAAALAALLVHLGTAFIVNHLPARLHRGGANPIDFDERAVLFMAAAACVAWLLSSLPVVIYASGPRLLDVLKTEGPTATGSGKSGLVRRTLTAVEIALAVMLLVAGVGYVRSYQALLALDKGFDSAGLVTISLSIPPQSYTGSLEKILLAREAVDRLRARPGVLSASHASAPPHMGSSYHVGQMEIDGRPPLEVDLTIAELDVDPDYFSVLGVPLLAGRMFEPGEPPDNVIVSETFARRHWPEEDPIGRSYRRSPGMPWMHVVGVVRHVRTDYDPPGARNTDILQTYVPKQPPLPPRPAQPTAARQPSTGGSYGFVNLMVRVDSRDRIRDLYQTVRSIDSRFILKVTFVEDEYARRFEDRLLATRVVGGFGVLAFLIAAAGIYGVMSFLVAHRTREIGIRIALGASRGDVGRLVVGSSLKLVISGAAAGVVAAMVASRWVQSQLYGVRALDPLAIGAVAVGVVVVALLATWRPARQATKVDPTLLLRG